MNEQLLLVEDEVDLAQPLIFQLSEGGYDVAHMTHGREALDFLRQNPNVRIVLLDLMLPDIPGTEVCRAIKRDPSTAHIPVLMLTAKSDEIDRVVGFEVGADDYVTKPFSGREVALRIRAILRRAHPAKSTAYDDRVKAFGALKVDAEGHRAWVQNEECTLTPLEFKLLEVLLNRRGRVQTREVLLQDVWSPLAEVTHRTVDTHIKRLRQKLGSVGEYIETMRGVGYRMIERPNEDHAT